MSRQRPVAAELPLLRLLPVIVPLMLLTVLLPSVTHASGSSFSFTNYPARSGLGTSAGEPSIGIDPATGSAYLQASAQTLRASFDDSTSPATATWSDITDPLAPAINADPILATDRSTGRTFAGGDQQACSIMSYTDDGGASWNPMADPCAPPGYDHPTIASGAWHSPPPAAATYPRAVYYCADAAIEQCATSLDGGITFLPPVTISKYDSPNGPGCNAFVGKMHVAGDGTAYLTSPSCSGGHPLKEFAQYGLDGGQGVILTQDNGLTWTTSLLPATRGTSFRFEPSVGPTPSGWVYAAWTDPDNHTYVSLSRDHGASWGAKTDIAALGGIASTTMSTITTGDDDRAAVAFLGTTQTGNAFNSSFEGSWDLYVAFTLDAGQTWTLEKATSDPVQRGWICTGGVTACSTNGGRNLLDFITAATDARGRVLVAYADGCIATCASATGTPSDSTSALATIARQSCGPSLFAARDNVEGTAACPTGTAIDPLPAKHQTQRYADAIVNGALFIGETFPVPLGTSVASVTMRDDVDPHAGGQWCIDTCDGTNGVSFCDHATLLIPTGTAAIIVVPDAGTITAPLWCNFDSASAPRVAGEATSGAITTDFS